MTYKMLSGKTLSGAALVLALAQPSSAAPNLPLNRPVNVAGIAAVCTGIGEEHQSDPRWSAYPVKIVFAGRGGQWVTDGDVAIAQNGRQLFAAHCEGPWMLVKLPAGRYRISGELDGQRDSEKAYAPRTGQGRVILRFPKAGGALSAEHTHKLRAMAENHAAPNRPRNP